MANDIAPTKNGYETTLNHAMDLWFLPEVERRQALGLIPKPFPLLAAQIIFYADERRREVRLNEEVRAVVSVKYKEGILKNAGDLISSHEIESFGRLELPPSEDPNCGHLTAIALDGGWRLAFDFVYNKGHARELILAGREFLETASDALERRRYRVLIDTLFSAAEIAANILLMVSPRDKESRYPTHGLIHSRFNQFAKLGNVEAEHRASFNKLSGMRRKARYGRGKFSLETREAEKLLEDVRGLLDRAAGLVAARTGSSNE